MARDPSPPARVSAGDIVAIRCPDGAVAYDSPGAWEPHMTTWQLEHDQLALVVCVLSHPPVDADRDAWHEALVLGGNTQLGWLEVSDLWCPV